MKTKLKTTCGTFPPRNETRFVRAASFIQTISLPFKARNALPRFSFCPFERGFIALLLLLSMAGVSATSIHDAAQAGDAACVRSILQTNAAAASLTNDSGETALHLGAGAASPEVVEALLAAKTPVDARTDCKMTALHYAIHQSFTSRFAKGLAKMGITNMHDLVERGGEVNADPGIHIEAGSAPAGDATARFRVFLESRQTDPGRAREELKVVQLLLAAGADPNASDLLGRTPVHYAAYRPQPEFLIALLEKGGNILAQAGTGETALHFAALLGSPITVNLLLAKGAKISKSNRFGNTPIIFAAKSGQPEIARLLLERGAFADNANDAGETPLYLAAHLQDREMVAVLLDQGHAAVNCPAGILSGTPLHTAASGRDAAMLRLLLEHKADVNARDKEGFTPLLNAAETGDLAAIQMLAQEGADLAARTKDDRCAFVLAAGSTNRLLLEWLAEKLPAPNSKDEVRALQTASLHGRLANVRWLLEKGVPAGATNSAGPPLLQASGGPGRITRELQQQPRELQCIGDEPGPEADYAQILSLLLTNGAPVNAAGSEGNTALHFAAAFACRPTAEILLRHKADVQARNAHGETPLHQAATFGNDRLVELLLANGAAIEAEDKSGSTPLLLAASRGNVATLKSLLAHGALVSARDRFGATPLHWAARTNVAAVLELLKAGAAIDALDNRKRTPLHQAALTGQGAIVKLLLERKADAAARDAGFQTPIELARQEGQFHIVTILSGQSPQPAKPRSE